MAKDLIKGVEDMDLYGILEIHHEATEKEIVKSYRKRALKCHPDKNPNNPRAVEEFHRLAKALEVLTDAAARAAYDCILKGRKAAKERVAKLDGQRKKFKEDLEAREKAASDSVFASQRAKRNLEAEIARLRKEGSSLLEEEKARLEEKLRKERAAERLVARTPRGEPADTTPRIKLNWKSKKDDPQNGGYSREYLEATFGKYGEINAIVLSRKNLGSAVIEFLNVKDAIAAFNQERGIVQNPLKLRWLGGAPRLLEENHTYKISDQNFNDFETAVLKRLQEAEKQKREGQMSQTLSHHASEPISDPVSSSPTPFLQNCDIDSNYGGSSVLSHGRDFETLSSRQLRQAEERKALLEKMMKEDEEK